MRHRTLLALLAIAAVAGCRSSAEPQPLGPLESRITQGEKQTYTAGGTTPDHVIDLVYRDVLTGSVRHGRPPLWERVLLPTLAYALQAVGVKAQPNSVVCVGEEQTILIPKVRCVNSDAEGNTRFEFLAATKAGTHKALIQATYGLEETEADTVEIIVLPDAADTLTLLNEPWLFTGSAVALSALVQRLSDRYGNTIDVAEVTVSDSGALRTRADSLVADSVERRTTVSLRADLRIATRVVATVRNLSATSWVASGRCGPMPGFQKGSSDVDSVTFSLSSRSIAYSHAPPTGTPTATVTWNGRTIFYLTGGGTVVDSLYPANDDFVQETTVLQQQPDSLGVAGWTGTAYVRTNTRRSGACLLFSSPYGAFTISPAP